MLLSIYFLDSYVLEVLLLEYAIHPYYPTIRKALTKPKPRDSNLHIRKPLHSISSPIAYKAFSDTAAVYALMNVSSRPL